MTEETVFARCVALDGSELLHERQIGWAGRWSLMGDFVLCAQCLAAQSIGLAQEPFEHLTDCVASQYGLHPTQLLSTGSFGTGIVKSYVDGVERVVGFRRVDEYPLVIFATLDKDEVLASWRQQSLLSAAIVALLLGILGVLGYRLIRLMNQQNHIQNELLGAQDKLIEANQALELLALEDALTGLANRRQFDLFLQSEMGRAKRSQENLSLLMLDVDHFKHFNDQYGHLTGDECLRTISTISTIIQANIKRPCDLAARYGGEEFAVVLPNTDYVGAFLVAENIRRAVQQAGIRHSECTEGTVTISLGVSTCIPASETLADDLIGAADKALYVAKTSGRNMSVIAN